MLKKVSIQNFGLIKDLDLSFKSGFTAITGETGAGKSFFTNALQLGFGGRAKEKFSDRCVVEVEFQEKIFRRVLQSGKSRFFIDDIPEKNISGQDFVQTYLDFHGQGDNLFLKNPDSASILLDNSLENVKVKSDFESKFKAFKKAKKILKDLVSEFSEFQNQREFWEFQMEKMAEINFSLEELEQAEISVSSQKDNLKLKPLILQTIDVLAGENESVLSKLDIAENNLREIDTEMAEKLGAFFPEITKIVQKLEKKIPEENIDLEASQEFILKVNRWQKQFAVGSPEALLEKKFTIAENLKYLQNLEQQIIQAEKVLEEKRKLAEVSAQKLSAERKKNQKSFGSLIQEKCRNLGMLPARFEVRFFPQDLGAQGLERVEFYFSANIEQELRPLSQTASGGEMARITLALKHFYPQKSTMIFDEIDTGVSGAIAEKMADEMKSLSQQKQIFAITHLPQIAAKADHHFVVEKTHFKNFTQTTIRELQPEERIEVLAGMLSGDKVTREAILAAKKLLEN